MSKRTEPRPADGQRSSAERSKILQTVLQILQLVVPLVATAWAFLSHLPPALKWLLIGASLAFLLWGGLRYRRQRLDKLRILNPDDLQITAGDFRGRGDETKELVKLLEDHPIVFLSGESGSGKTTFVEWKIIPASTPRFSVVKIDSYGADWCGGPLRKLMQSLEPPLATVGDTEALLSRLEEHLAQPGRTHLLIFDQFDYYLATCQQHLISGGAVIDSVALAAANGFWRCVLSQAEQGHLKCLLVIERSQRPYATPFGPRAKDYPLPRLPASYSSGILRDVLDRAGISTEDVTDLVERISTDLDPQSLLPVQLELTLRSLQHLRPLTVRHYNRMGGLPGLIALGVSTEIRQAAESASLPYLAAVETLCQLLDESTGKPRVVKEAALATPVGGSAQSHLQLLGSLAGRRITKRQGDEAGEPSWTLYHEFLVRVLLSLRSNALGQELALQQTYARFTQKPLPKKLGHLLSPWAALKLLPAGRAARGRMSLAYLWLSLCFWPLLILGSAAYGVETWREREASALSADILSSFDTDGSLTGEEVKKLWLLAQESPRVKDLTLRAFLSHDTNAQRLVSHGAEVMQSLLGLEPDSLRGRLSNLWQELCQDDQIQNLDNFQRGGCALIENEIAHPTTAATWQYYLDARVPEDLLVASFLAMPPPERQEAMGHLRQALGHHNLWLSNQRRLLGNMLAAAPLPERTSYGQELLETPGIADSPDNLLALRSTLPTDVARDLELAFRAKAIELLGNEPGRSNSPSPLQWAKNVSRFETAGWDVGGALTARAQRTLAEELRMHLTDYETLTLLEDLTPFSSNLNPEDSATARRLVLKMLNDDCIGSRLPLQATWIAGVLTSEESLLVLEWLERQSLGSFGTFNSAPQDPTVQVASLRTLERLALNLTRGERSRMLQGLWPRIQVAGELRTAAPLLLIGFVLNAAEPAPPRSPVDFVREIGRLRLRSKDAGQDENVTLLARWLWPRLDAPARRAFESILRQMFRELIVKQDPRSAAMARVLDDLAISLAGPESREILDSLLHQAQPPCEALGPLVGPETSRLFLEEVFRYPTCPLGVSSAVLTRFEARAIFRLGKVGWRGPDMAFLSRRKLVGWMESKGYATDRRLKLRVVD